MTQFAHEKKPAMHRALNVRVRQGGSQSSFFPDCNRPLPNWMRRNQRFANQPLLCVGVKTGLKRLMTTRRLFELMTDDGCSISPYVWRTKYALAAKELPYESCGVGFVDVPAIGSGGFRTLPILEDAGDRWVGDSWAIAAYLDETYPERALFPCKGEHALALFFDKWLAVEVISNLFRICVLDIHNRVRKADKAYFRQSRETRLGQPLEAAHAERERYLPAFRQSLQPMRLALRPSPFLGGDSPGYADFIAIAAFIWAGAVATVDLLERDDPLLEWIDRCLSLYGGIGASLALPGLGRTGTRA